MVSLHGCHTMEKTTMPSRTKGSEHKNLLLKNAIHMMYERGYNEMSLRDLATISNDNVAIFNYYFGNKYNMAFNIYADIVNGYYAILHERLNLSPRDEFILFNLIELKLCMTDSSFRRLYYEFSQLPSFINSMQNNFVGHVLKHYPDRAADQAILQALSVVHVKAAFVTYEMDRTRYNMNLYADIDLSTYLQFYLTELLLSLEHSTDKLEYFLQLLNSIDISMGKDFEIIIH